MNRRLSGFTLMELTVVVGIIMVLTAAIVPNVVRQRDARQERAFLGDLQRLVGQGSVRANDDRRTVTLGYDASIQTFSLYQEATTDTAEQPVKDLTMPGAFEVSAVRMGQEQVAAQDWKLHFYSDGRCDGGAIELLYNGEPRTLMIDVKAHAKWQPGQLPDDQGEEWAVGDYVRRT